MDHLGLDLGTTTISAAVLDADGRLLCTRTVPGGAAVAGQPWERKQDASGIECTALSLLDGLLQEFPDIGCVGLTGQMHGIVYVDAAGQLLSPLYTWQDETGAQPGPDGKSTAARLTARTGYPLASGYGLVTLACHQAAGTIPNGAAAVCTIADYLAMRLSGRTAPCLTPSMAASLGLFDGTDFDREAVRRAGLPERLLPEVSEKAELTGGRLHVFAALGDNQASFLGAGQGRLDAPLVNIGTGSQFSFFTKERRTVPGLETRPFPGGWLLTGAPLCGGRSFALLERFFARRPSWSREPPARPPTPPCSARWRLPCRTMCRSSARRLPERGRTRRSAPCSADWMRRILPPFPCCTLCCAAWRTSFPPVTALRSKPDVRPPGGCLAPATVCGAIPPCSVPSRGALVCRSRWLPSRRRPPAAQRCLPVCSMRQHFDCSGAVIYSPV